MVKVVPLEPVEADTSRRSNFLRDANWTIPDNFDTFMQDEIVAMFEGDED